jgi:hypothetical protein
MRNFLFAILAIVTASASAETASEVVCSYSPSQSEKVAAISAAGAGGAAATIASVAAATGLTVVTHSSGALILTGASGYIGGTIGGVAAAGAVAAAAAPVIVGVSLVVAGTAVTVELICASKNHPELVAKVQDAAIEFSRRFGDAMQRTKVAIGNVSKSVPIATGKAVVEVKRMANDVWNYAYRKNAPPANCGIIPCQIKPITSNSE